MTTKAKTINFVLEKLNQGAQLSIDNIRDIISEEFDESVSKRTIQRYMNEIITNYAYVERIIKDGKSYLTIPNNYRAINTSDDKLQFNGMLILSVLQSQSKYFENTVIEAEINKLIAFISKQTGINQDLIADTDSIYWEQNYGKYDYSNDEDALKILNQAIKLINNKYLVRVKYSSVGEKEFECIMQKLFYYMGGLYVACYIPKHKQTVALTVQRISSISILKESSITVPDFDYLEFTKDRFGVYQGEVQRVVLEINPDFTYYFENRTFHQSQHNYVSDGVLSITLDVPVSPELVNWICGWGIGIEVKSPEALKDRIIQQANEMLSMYDK